MIAKILRNVLVFSTISALPHIQAVKASTKTESTSVVLVNKKAPAVPSAAQEASLRFFSPTLLEVLKVYPQTLSGWDKLPSVEVLGIFKNNFREDFRQISQQAYLSIANYYCDQILDYVQGIQIDEGHDLFPIKGSILREANLMRSEKLALKNWQFLFQRALHLQSEVLGESADEAKVQNIFEFLSGSRRFFAGLAQGAPVFAEEGINAQKAAWMQSSVAIEMNDTKTTRGQTEMGFYTGPMSQNKQNVHDETFRGAGISGMPWLPFVGAGKYGLGLGLRGFIENFAFIAMPRKHVNAHSVSMSPFWVAAHDVLHAEIYDLENTYEAAAAKLDNDLTNLSSELSYRHQSKIAVDFVVRRALAMKNRSVAVWETSMQEFLQEMAKIPSLAVDASRISKSENYLKALRKKTEIDAKRKLNMVLGTLFELYHEEGVREELFRQSLSMHDFYNQMIQNAFAVQFSAEDLDQLDPLKTDPLTGQTGLSEAELLQKLVSMKGHIQYSSGHPVFLSEPISMEARQGEFDDAEPLKRVNGPMVYNFERTLRNGQVFVVEQNTLAYGLGNALDKNALLSLAGYGVHVGDVPTLQRHSVPHAGGIAIHDRSRFESLMTLEDRRQAALEFMQAVYQKQNARAQDFLRWHNERFPQTQADALLDQDAQEREEFIGKLQQRSYETQQAFDERKEKVRNILTYGVEMDPVQAAVPPMVMPAAQDEAGQ